MIIVLFVFGVVLVGFMELLFIVKFVDEIIDIYLNKMCELWG